MLPPRCAGAPNLVPARFHESECIMYILIKESRLQWRRSLRRDDKLESDDRSPLVLRSNPVTAAFAFLFANLRKRDFRRLHP